MDVSLKAVAVSVAVLALAACGDPEPIVTETPAALSAESPSPTSSPSPSPTTLTTAQLLEVLPEGADLPDVRGAIVTAEFFVVEYSRMLRSGDTSIWDALSGPECDFCAYGTSIARDYREGGFAASGGDVTVDVNRTRGRLDDDGFTYVGVVVTQNEIIVDSPDGTSRTYDGSTYALAFQMALVDGAWQIIGGQVVDPSEIQ